MPAWLRFIRARLDPVSYLGLQLSLGALLLIGASWAFGSIAEEVLEREELVAVDMQLSYWLNSLQTPWLTDIMLKVSSLHGMQGMTALVLVAALLLAWKRYWTWMVILLFTVPSGAALNVLMKTVFERARPSFASSFMTVTDYSFPSGHTCASTLFYGVLAAFLVPRMPSWRWRALVCWCALGLIALVAFSRLYLGAHFLTDVLGGFAEGIAWLALCVTAAHTFARHRAERRSRLGTGRQANHEIVG